LKNRKTEKNIIIDEKKDGRTFFIKEKLTTFLVIKITTMKVDDKIKRVIGKPIPP
jgi:hypothetical protein